MKRLSTILSTTLIATIFFSTGAMAALQCNECHGTSSPDDNRPLDAPYRNVSSGGFMGNHRTHMGTGASPASCNPCHGNGVNVSTYLASHRDGSISMVANINNSPKAGGATYSKGVFFNQTTAPVTGSCSNVNCHFESTTPTWGGAVYVSPNDCNKCHGVPPSGGATGAAGSHSRHDVYYPGATNCQKCHSNNTTFDHATSAGKRSLNISFAAAPNNGSGTYSGPLNDYLPSQANVFGTCANTYCHSNGTSISSGSIPANTTVTWGTAGPLACNACHGNPPAYTSGSPKANSHGKHTAATCDKCHFNTTSNGTTITNAALHDNKTYDVNPGTGISLTYSFATGGGTCSTISCHFNGTATWGGSVACGGCHPFTNTTLTSGSHATHLSALKGPNGVVPTTVTCDSCHGAGATLGTHTGHGGGVVVFVDGNTLAATNVCDSCHSPGGPYDGVNNATIGAKPNWSFRVYTGSNLKAGKERWCVTCHDSGTSVIGGRQAPDMAGNNSTFGYYGNGHGAKGTECGACHGLNMNHKIDGKKTFKVISGNYKQGFRLKDVGGLDPLKIPRTIASCVDYTPGDFRLCFSCHNEQSLMNDTRSGGVFGCTSNPYKGAPATTTLFQNVSLAGYTWSGMGIPANIHWDHLVDVDKTFSNSWKPDGVGVSAGSCTLCHNPHGGSYSGTPEPKMTHGDYQLVFGTDGNGDYGSLSGTTWTNSSRCSITCHSANQKYYRPLPYPKLDGLSVADSNPADPAPAEAGYTNARAVTITVAASGNAATQMIFAEDAAFTVNSTGWIAYAGTYGYTLSAGEGTKTVYGMLKNASGSSGVISATIFLDQTAPVVPAATITSPNGAELWDRGTAHTITWNTGGITDANLKASPVTIDYSTNSGASYPNAIVAGVANSGTYSWLLPSSINSTQVQVRLTATDRAGNQAIDTSNADFTIRALTPVLSPITVADNNNADPSPADPGYTNNRTVAVTITASNFPDQMMIAENAAFTTNTTGWITFAASYNYMLTSGDGSKTVYVKVQNAAGVSGTQSAAIILDTAAPAILATTLTAPNGNELWTRGSSQTVTWTGANITDTNLKASPIAIDYSTDGGATWPNSLTSGVANSGSYVWNPLPSIASYTARVRITATDKAGNRSYDSSNANFYISTPYIVTNTADSGAGSLRQAITDVVAAGGNNAIWFNIPSGSLTNGVAVIAPATNLPALSQSGITIDGGSQTSLVGNTNANGPEVRISGTGGFGGMSGLDVTASNASIKNLQITNCAFGVRTNSANTVIDGNQIGLTSDNTGTYSFYPTTYNRDGVDLVAGSTNATVGGTVGNFISGNALAGITDAGSGNRIMNNTIGLLPNGSLAGNDLFTSGNDIFVSSATGTPPTNCLIQGNTICGAPGNTGIYLDQRVEGCSIKGNILGLRYNAGTWTKIGAQLTSITLNTTGYGNNTIGGPNVASSDAVLNDSNVFNSSTAAIYLQNNTSTKPNKVYGNFIGTNPQKTQVFGGAYGVQAYTPINSVIGGGGAGEAGNVITNMSTNGVFLANIGGFNIKISRNSFYNNGTSAPGSDDAIILLNGANSGVTRPVITVATTTAVTVGSVAAGDTVEVYISDYSGSGTPYGEGKTFVGSAVAGGTSVVVPVSGVSSGAWLTATRTKATQDTSPFSANVIVP